MPRKKKKIKIVKMDGSKEEFKKEKIVSSITSAGAPEKVAKEIADKVEKAVEKGMTTRQIRRIVLNELEERNPKWADNWKYYDRIMKGRITFENGKFVVVQKGRLYLGTQVKDIGPKGLSNYEEVEGILKEMEEDLEAGVPRKTINSRTFVLFMAVLKSKKMKKEDKTKSIEVINKFREKMGWKPFEVKKPIK